MTSLNYVQNAKTFFFHLSRNDMPVTLLMMILIINTIKFRFNAIEAYDKL